MLAAGIDEGRSRLEPHYIDPWPDQGKASVPRSGTTGANASLPLNHGLIVWWSDDGTSVGIGAMRPRICADTTSLAISSPACRCSAPRVIDPARTAPARKDAAKEPHAGMWRGGRKAGLDIMRRLRPGDDPRQDLNGAPTAADGTPRSRRQARALDASRASKLRASRGSSLAVKIGIEKKLVVVGESHDASPQTASSSLRRARASRDITVPIGSSAISAMAR